MVEPSFKFIDTHIHIGAQEGQGAHELLVQAQALGLHELWLPAVSLADSKRNLELVATAPLGLQYYPFAGVHPMEAMEFNEATWARYWAQQGACFTGIGEIGLDKRFSVPMATQLAVFDYFFSLAYQEHLPVLIHCVGAHNELLHYLKSRHQKLPRGVIHGACVSVETALSYHKYGFYLGLGAAFMAPNAAKVLAMAKALPLEALVTETDWPYMNGDKVSASGHRLPFGPLNLTLLIKFLAHIRGQDEVEVAQALIRNAQMLRTRALS